VVSTGWARPQESNTVFYHHNCEMGPSCGMGLLQSTLCDLADKLLQASRSIRYCKLIVVIVNILRMACLWFICAIFCSWGYGVDSRKWNKPLPESSESLFTSAVLLFAFPFYRWNISREALRWRALMWNCVFIIHWAAKYINYFEGSSLQGSDAVSGGRVFPGTGLLRPAFISIRR
jgi:hypothetical protein